MATHKLPKNYEKAKNEPIVSVSQFVDSVSKVHKKWFEGDRFWQPWFRGLGDINWELQPRLYRIKRPIDELLEEEEELRSEFRRRGLQLMSQERIPQSEYEWYFLMQHHGVQTRLLDWPDGSLTALYFAVEPYTSRNNDKHDAVVWMLDPYWLNDQTFRKRDDAEGVAQPDWEVSQQYLPEIFVGRRLRRSYPIAMDPSHISRRVAVQRSRFVIFGTNKNGITHVAEASKNPRLVSFRIKYSAIRRIQKELETCGITRATVFPDLDGLSRELRRIMRQQVSLSK